MERYQIHKKALNTINEILAHPEKYMTIHYSCESFVDGHGGHSSRITSIAVCDMDKQCHTFSLHTSAEEMGIELTEICETNYNEIEHFMLKKYGEFLQNNKSKFFIHWNMRNTTYGFFAIEHRFSVLSKQFNEEEQLYEIPDAQKINLAQLLQDIYGFHYIEDPRMVNILNFNNIKPKLFLSGKEEAEAFANKNYIGLHNSTTSKVGIFVHIIQLISDDKLLTKASWREIYGVSIQSLWQLSKDKWPIALLMTIALAIFSSAISHLL